MTADVHAAPGQSRRALTIALTVTATILLVEVVGAIVSGSLALLADAGHMLTDVAALVIALVASILAARPADRTRTFGLLRLEVLSAAVNAGMLLVVGVIVAAQAIGRLFRPEAIVSTPMLIIGIVGLAGNLVSAAILSGHARSNLNARGAYLEVLNDALGSVAVVASAIIIMATGWDRADPIAALLVAALIVPRTISLLKESGHVLLEASPRGVDVDEVRRHILAIDGVEAVHDIHVWSISTSLPVLSAHVVVNDPNSLAEAGECGSEQGSVLDRLARCLAGDFDIEHSTFQLERPGHRGGEPPPHN